MGYQGLMILSTVPFQNRIDRFSRSDDRCTDHVPYHDVGEGKIAQGGFKRHPVFLCSAVDTS
jgi:hypothetical protein